MEGGITARPLDYFGLLVAAGTVALASAGVTAICIKYEERGLAWLWRAAFFGSALVAAYCLGKVLLRAESLFTPVLTSHTEKDETFAETGHNTYANISLQFTVGGRR
jgi:hypothetical protein